MSTPLPMSPVSFPALLDSVEVPVVALDEDASTAWVNDAGEQWLGKSRQRLLGRPISTCEPWGPALGTLAGRVAKDGMSVQQEVNTDATSVTLLAAPWWEADRIRGCVIWVQTPNLLAHGERPDVAALAAGLAHEVRNPLAALRGAAELLAADLPAGATNGSEYVDLILREAARVDSLVSRLLDVARPVPLARSRFRGDELLHDLARHAQLLSRGSGLAVVVEETYDPTLPLLTADRERLFEALVNLLKNAIEALPKGGGRISLGAAFDSKRHRTPAGSQALMAFTIRDTGPGLGSARDRLFTPFFTTKASGTGLGLLMARRVAEAHGGVLTLRDRLPPDSGAEAQMLIPLEGD